MLNHYFAGRLILLNNIGVKRMVVLLIDLVIIFIIFIEVKVECHILKIALDIIRMIRKFLEHIIYKLVHLEPSILPSDD